MKLVLDQGNTLCKAAIFDGQQCIQTLLFEPTIGTQQVEQLIEQYGPFGGAIYCSTAERDESFEQYLRAESVLVFHHTTKIPLTNLYHTPHTLGLDRLATAVGAAERFKGQDLIIFDLGSAITIDFVSANGEFLGGNISAGLSMRLEALHRFTGRLPRVDVSDMSLEPYGKDTKSALILGAVRGIVNEIEGYIDENRNKIVIFAGGDALFFEKQIKKPIFADCQATLSGLLSILEYNA